jgi:hypothetical protein
MTKVTPAQERLEDKFIPEPNTGCFIWLGSVDPQGYGRIFYDGANWRASRVSWKLSKGSIGSLHVLHRCDNRLCVNPDHLFLGTNQDNILDKAKKGRVASAKLSPDKVKAIRRQRADGASLSDLADQYGVTPATVHASIVGKRTWAHVTA